MENDTFPRTENDTPATPATILDRRLTWLLLLWPAALMAIAWLSNGYPDSIQHWLYELGMFLSPVLAAVLVGIALHHRPVLHHFLKVVVVLSLVVLAATNFKCAKTASEGNLLEALTKDYNIYSTRTPIEGLVGLYSKSVVTPPSFLRPFNDQAHWLLLFLLIVFQHYSMLTGPFFLLLLLILPSFLAIPLFWLWLVLSVLYVVLPQRAWGWMKAGVVRVSEKSRRGKGL